MSSTERIAQQLIEHIQGFIRLRPKLIVPEHVSQIRRKLAELKRSGIVGSEDHTFFFRVFIILAKAETPPTMGELSAELDVPLSTATRIVDSLVGAGLVERLNDPHDRRVVRVQMADEACRLFQTAMDYNKQRLVRLLDNFTPEEQEQLLHLTTKLYDSLLAEKQES